jgi:hypothetical protein
MRDIITKLEELNVEKPQLNEGLADMAHEAEKDHEVQMARSDCYKSAKYAVAIHKMLKDVSEMEGIDGWVAAKITKAADYLGSVKHYMEGQAMSDVELAVVPVAGDMTDAMTMPQESIEEVHEAEERTYIVVHAKHGKEEIKASSSYGAAKKYAEMKKLKSTAGVDAHLADEEKTATESIAEGRLGFKDIAKFGSAIASKIDMEARRRGSADMEPGDADELRYKIAKEMGLVESQVVENAERIIKVTNIDFAGPSPDKMQLPTSVTLRLNVPYDADEDDIDDMVADDLEDRYGVKVIGFETQFGESVEEENLDEAILGEKSKWTQQSKAAADAAMAAAPGRTIDDMKPAERANLKKFVQNTPQNTSKPAQDFYKKMGYNKLANEEQVAEEDVIGDIIASLNKTKERMPLPKSKPNAPKKPAVSAQQAQAQANKAVRSMGQDKTTGDPRGILRQSKFSEWSKK